VSTSITLQEKRKLLLRISQQIPIRRAGELQLYEMKQSPQLINDCTPELKNQFLFY
jgi:hypothetical protein